MKDSKGHQSQRGKWTKQKIIALIIAAVIIVAAAIAIPVAVVSSNQPEDVSYNDFMDLVQDEKVEKIIYDYSDAKLTFYQKENDQAFKTDNPKVDGFKEEMLKHNVEVEEASTPVWMTILSYILPYLPFAVLIIIILRMIPRNGSYNVEVAGRPDTTFDDVAGLDEIKEDMKLIAETLKNPTLCTNLGAHMTKGVLLEGEPGNGKTLFARALAGETGVNFYSANASEFIEMYAGLGASRIRKLFKEAREHAPSVVFIDELDAIGSKRDGSTDGAGREYTQCLNALLAAIDGFEASDGVLVIGATNRSEDLDPALVRPGRFDKQFILPPPDCIAREQILRLHAKGKRFAQDVDFSELARDTIGYSGSGLESLLNESALLALKQRTPEISRSQIEEASLQIAMKGHIKNGIGNRNIREQKIVSYHEAGHTVATLVLTDHAVRRVTVLPTTSGAGGLTMSVPPADENLPTIEQLESRIRILYAGRAAEYVLAGKVERGVTVGAVSDIQEATKSIQTLVTLTQKQGLLNYAEFGLSGQEKQMELSETVSERLWNETVTLIENNWSLLVHLAETLLVRETLRETEIMEIYREYQQQS